MKKITLVLLALSSFASFSQEEKKEETSGARSSNWILEASVGHIKGVKPYADSYFSSKPNGVFGQLEANSFSVGARYLVGEILSFKASGHYDRFRNFNTNNQDTGEEAKPFDMRQYGLQLQGYVNGAKLFGVSKELGRFNMLFHGGLNIVAMTSKTENIWVNGELENHNFNQTEWNGGLVIGVTPEFRLTKKLALQLDVTSVHNYRQHFNWDGSYSDEQENLSGSTISASLGLSFSLDSNMHGDWYSVPKADDEKIKKLEDKLSELETLMNDTDKDGVPDYLDQENNSVAGVAVDSRGKMLDINRNGVPDELERGKDGMNGVNAGNMSKEDAIKMLIEKGYVNIFYDLDKDVPNSGSINNVFYIVKFLKNYPDSKITLMGFADERGSAEYNADLTARRVKNLSDIIKASGIDMNRIKVVGKGETTEFLSTELGYDLSRRVSVKLE